MGQVQSWVWYLGFAGGSWAPQGGCARWKGCRACIQSHQRCPLGDAVSGPWELCQIFIFQPEISLAAW